MTPERRESEALESEELTERRPALTGVKDRRRENGGRRREILAWVCRFVALLNRGDWIAT